MDDAELDRVQLQIEQRIEGAGRGADGDAISLPRPGARRPAGIGSTTRRRSAPGRTGARPRRAPPRRFARPKRNRGRHGCRRRRAKDGPAFLCDPRFRHKARRRPSGAARASEAAVGRGRIGRSARAAPISRPSPVASTNRSASTRAPSSSRTAEIAPLSGSRSTRTSRAWSQGDARSAQAWDLSARGISERGQVIAIIGAAEDRRRLVGQHHPALPRRHRGQAEMLERDRQAIVPRLDPVMEEVAALDRRAIGIRGRGRKAASAARRRSDNIIARARSCRPSSASSADSSSPSRACSASSGGSDA